MTLTGNEPPGEPRYFPEPHPDRAGSLGDEVGAYARDVIGQPFLPWQERVADRLLEHDADGTFCWPRSIVLVPRQSGKSTLLRALCEYMASRERAVLSTSAKLATVAHLMRASQLRLRDAPGFNVKMAKDQPEINWPGAGEMSGRWISQAANPMLGRGFSADIAVIDEVQDVPIEAMESLSPALVEAPNPLTLAFGTAARGLSELLNRLRDDGLRGGGVALIEWSAPRDLPVMDEETWRLASPRWTPQRLRHLREESRIHDESHIRSEYLCQPVAGGEDPWFDLAAWHAARADLVVPDRPQVCAVEDEIGGSGASVALAWPDGDRVCATAFRVDSLAAAWRWASIAERVRCGITLGQEPDAKKARAKLAGRRETATALPELRRLLPDGLRWDGDALAEQMVKVQVRETPAGMQVLGGTPSALVRTLAWAVQDVRTVSDPVLV